MLLAIGFSIRHASAQAPDPSNRETLRAALDALLPELAACDALLAPGAGGRLILSFVITPAGAVANVRTPARGKGAANETTLRSPAVAACARAKAGGWVFPRARLEKERSPRVNVEVPVGFPVGGAREPSGPGFRGSDPRSGTAPSPRGRP